MYWRIQDNPSQAHPNRLSIDNRKSRCGTDPKAFLSLNHTRWRNFRHLHHRPDQEGMLKAPLARHIPVLREREIAPASVAQTASLFVQTAAYTGPCTMHSAGRWAFDCSEPSRLLFVQSISRGVPLPDSRHSTLAPTDLKSGKTLCVSITFHIL